MISGEWGLHWFESNPQSIVSGNSRASAILANPHEAGMDLMGRALKAIGGPRDVMAGQLEMGVNPYLPTTLSKPTRRE